MRNLLTFIFFCAFGHIMAQNTDSGNTDAKASFTSYFSAGAGLNVIDNTLLASGWSLKNLNMSYFPLSGYVRYHYHPWMSVQGGATINILNADVLQQGQELNEDKFYFSFDVVNAFSLIQSKGFELSIPVGLGLVNAGGNAVISGITGLNMQYMFTEKWGAGINVWYKRHGADDWLGASHGQLHFGTVYIP